MAKQIYYEDVKEGDELPGFSMEFDPYRVVTHVGGTQDHHPMHHNVERARGVMGFPDPFAQNLFLLALCTRVVTDWCGDEGWLRKFRMEIRRMNHPGDTLTVKGKVAGKRVEDRNHLVDVDIWLENQRDGVSVPCHGVVILPARGS